MPFFRLILGSLCVFRVTHLLHAEDGPWDLLVALRRAAGDGMPGRLLDCFYCLSLWVAVPFALLLGEGLSERLLFIPALSAGAIVLQRLTARDAPAAALYHEDPENALLRSEESPDAEHQQPPPHG